jgi:hypothetical protein
LFIVAGGGLALTGRVRANAPVRGASPVAARAEPAE